MTSAAFSRAYLWSAFCWQWVAIGRAAAMVQSSVTLSQLSLVFSAANISADDQRRSEVEAKVAECEAREARLNIRAWAESHLVAR